MEISKVEKSRIIYRCGNRNCRVTITKFREFCRPCLQHFQMFKKNRRPKNRKKIVCSNSACFSCVWPEEIRKHPVSENWICLSCYKKEARQLEIQAKIKEEEAPDTQDPASSDCISYETYQEAMKVHNAVPMSSEKPTPQNFDETESQCSDDSFPVIEDFSFSDFDDEDPEDFINNYHDPLGIPKSQDAGISANEAASR